MKISAEKFAQRLGAELGSSSLSDDAATLGAHCVDGQIPALYCAPSHAEQVSVVLRLCAEAEAAVIPCGGASAMALGNPPHAADVVLATTRLDKVVEHDAANLTATVQAGIVLDDLQNVLTAQKQRAPLDPPFPERATIGGIVAANLNGPRRSYYGNVRDLVIGMKVALASGELIKAGGKVVKNVAGYDMCKLFTGSLGTLGIITEVTLRMAAIPEQSVSINAAGSLEQTLQLADALASAPLLPAAVLLSSREGSQGQWQLTIRCDGFHESNTRQITDIQAMAHVVGIATNPAEGELSKQHWQQFCDLPLQRDAIVYRLTVPRATLRLVLQTITNSGLAHAIRADLAAGVVWIACSAANTAKEQFPKLLALAAEQGGHAVMFAAPAELKAGLDVWGPPPPSLALMRKTKLQFDPQGILNPGRFLSGL